MRNIKITMTKQYALEFKATDKEVQMLEMGTVPDRIQEELDELDWKNGWQDYAVWDADNMEQLVDFD